MITSLLLTLSIAPAAIEVSGEGCLRFLHEGRVVYSRSARLSVSEQHVVDEDGDPVMPSVLVPAEAQAIEVDEEGSVTVRVASGSVRVGRLVLALFEPSAVLVPNGRKLIAADRPKLANPGEGGAGIIRPAAPKTAGASAIPVATAGGPLTLKASEKAEVDGPEILLKDIAVLSGPADAAAKLGAISFGSSPALGIVRSLDLTVILARIKSVGIDPKTLTVEAPKTLQIRRKGQTVMGDRFVEAAFKALSQPNGPAYRCETPQSEYYAPLGDLKLTVESITGAGTGMASCVVAVFVDGRRINSRTLRFSADLPAMLVTSGQTVKVTIKAGGAAVELTGICRGTGALGAVVAVEVKVGESKTTHQGTVTGPGAVEVKI